MADSRSNGWSEYQRLVLAELERHNMWMKEIDTRFQEIRLQNHEITNKVQRLEAMTQQLVVRVDGIEKVEQAEAAVAKYKKAIFGIMIALATAILIPIIRLFIGGI